jgi:hypothetical protein
MISFMLEFMLSIPPLLLFIAITRFISKSMLGAPDIGGEFSTSCGVATWVGGCCHKEELDDEDDEWCMSGGGGGIELEAVLEAMLEVVAVLLLLLLTAVLDG